jgi:predicted nicotinamide N-methyase
MSKPEDNNPRLRRRLLVTRAASGAGLAALAAGTASAQSGRSDSDPSDRPGYGRRWS